NSLPQYGSAAVGPLLVSLRSVETLTKEQRGQLPSILTTIGPAAIPTLLRHVGDPHEHVRAVVAATLGRLHVQDAVPLLVPLVRAPSDRVRGAAARALGGIAAATAEPRRKRRGWRRPAAGTTGMLWWRREPPVPALDPTGLAVTALLTALDDESAAVRTQA